jgi:hypothetical protein
LAVAAAVEAVVTVVAESMEGGGQDGHRGGYIGEQQSEYFSKYLLFAVFSFFRLNSIII